MTYEINRAKADELNEAMRLRMKSVFNIDLAEDISTSEFAEELGLVTIKD